MTDRSKPVPKVQGTTGNVPEKVEAAWAKHAESLADWAMTRLAVRKDVNGAYDKDGQPFTSRDPLTRDLVIRHFRGAITIGFHSISTEGKCLTAAWDLDAHGDQDDQVVKATNWKAA